MDAECVHRHDRDGLGIEVQVVLLFSRGFLLFPPSSFILRLLRVGLPVRTASIEIASEVPRRAGGSVSLLHVPPHGTASASKSSVGPSSHPTHLLMGVPIMRPEKSRRKKCRPLFYIGPSSRGLRHGFELRSNSVARFASDSMSSTPSPDDNRQQHGS